MFDTIRPSASFTSAATLLLALRGGARDRSPVRDRILLIYEVLKELNLNSPPRAVESTATPQTAESLKPSADSIDTSKRYDVYCMEQTVYRKALFKGAKKLSLKGEYGAVSEFLELELADGKAIYVARHSIIKFCEHGVTPGSETISG